MATIHQTQPTIQLLLSSADFVSALDLIDTSLEVLTQELAGVQCFRYSKYLFNLFLILNAVSAHVILIRLDAFIYIWSEMSAVTNFHKILVPLFFCRLLRNFSKKILHILNHHNATNFDHFQ